jgi:hypothetical protein
MDDCPPSFGLGSTEVGKADVLGAEGVSENDSCASTDSRGFTVLPTCGVCCWPKASKDAQSPPLTDGALLCCSRTGCGAVKLTGCGGVFTGCCCGGVGPVCDGGADAVGSGSAPKSIKLTGLAALICSEVPSEEPILLAVDVVLYRQTVIIRLRRTFAQKHDISRNLKSSV